MLREFERSPFIKGMARNWLNHASACVTGYHLGGQFISPEGGRPEGGRPEGGRPEGDMNDHRPQLYPVAQEEAGFNLYMSHM